MLQTVLYLLAVVGRLTRVAYRRAAQITAGSTRRAAVTTAMAFTLAAGLMLAPVVGHTPVGSASAHGIKTSHICGAYYAGGQHIPNPPFYTGHYVGKRTAYTNGRPTGNYVTYGFWLLFQPWNVPHFHTVYCAYR